MAGNATAAQVALGPDWGSLGWHVTSGDLPEQLTCVLTGISFPFCLGRAKREFAFILAGGAVLKHGTMKALMLPSLHSLPAAGICH